MCRKYVHNMYTSEGIPTEKAGSYFDWPVWRDLDFPELNLYYYGPQSSAKSRLLDPDRVRSLGGRGAQFFSSSHRRCVDGSPRGPSTKPLCGRCGILRLPSRSRFPGVGLLARRLDLVHKGHPSGPSPSSSKTVLPSSQPVIPTVKSVGSEYETEPARFGLYTRRIG